MNSHVMRQKTYVNADPEETLQDNYAKVSQSIHSVTGLKVVKNPNHHLPRDEDLVRIDIAIGNQGQGISITLFAKKGVQL